MRYFRIQAIISLLTVPLFVSQCGMSPKQDQTLTLMGIMSFIWNPIIIDEPVPAYPDVSQLNRFIAKDGGHELDHSATACDPLTALRFGDCVHAGIMRVIDTNEISSCKDLYIEDSLGLLRWDCRDTDTGVQIYSMNFQDWKGLQDAIDFDTMQFKEIAVNVYRNENWIARTYGSQLFTDPIVGIAPDGTNTQQSLDAPYTVYAVATGGINDYLLGAEGVSLVGADNAWLQGAPDGTNAIVSSNGSHFQYVEGNFTDEGTTAGGGVDLNSSTPSFVRLHNIRSISSSDFALSVKSLSAISSVRFTVKGTYTGAVMEIDSGSIIHTIRGHFSANKISAQVLYCGGNAPTFQDIAILSTDVPLLYTEGPSRVYNNITYGGVSGAVDAMSPVGGTLQTDSMQNILIAQSAGNGIILNNEDPYMQALSITGIDGDSLGNGAGVDWLNNGIYGPVLLDGTATCTPPGGSGFDTSCNPVTPGGYYTRTDSSGVGGSIVGHVTDEKNSDDDAQGLGSGIPSDFYSFEHEYRLWGRDSTGDTLDSGVRGFCDGSTANCRIWDVALRADDTQLRDVNPAPGSGDDYHTVAWADNAPDCSTDPLRPTRYDSGVALCVSDVLDNAVEFLGDNQGNENGLCDANERCLYTPNIGAYQGHGRLIPMELSGGTVSGVRLYRYEHNGYE